MATGVGKTSAVLTDPPPPLPKKRNVVSAPAGGPLPVPSKGIRRPPPAVPARCIPAAAASPTTECNGSIMSTSSEDSPGVAALVDGFNQKFRVASVEKQVRGPVSELQTGSSSNHSIGGWVHQQIVDGNSAGVYSNVLSSGPKSWSNGSSGDWSNPIPSRSSTSQGAGYSGNQNASLNILRGQSGHPVQTVSCGGNSGMGMNVAKSTKDEESTDQISNLVKRVHDHSPVSYTHLTLPTIYSV